MGFKYIISITIGCPEYLSIVKKIPDTKKSARVISDIGVRISGTNAVTRATKKETPRLKNWTKINIGTTKIDCQ